MIPATFVVLASAETDEVVRMVVSEDDRATMQSVWDSPDPLLTRLSHIPWIGERNSWSKLDRSQIQALIAIQMSIHNEAQEGDHLISLGLKIAVVALITHFEQDNGWVSLMRINHLGPLKLEVDITMTCAVEMEPAAQQPPEPGIRVIVDNS